MRALEQRPARSGHADPTVLPGGRRVHPAVAAGPLQADGDPRGDQRDGVQTRSRALAGLLADPDARRAIGSAWPLYMLLVLGWGGTATGTREEIGARMAEDGRNVGNWVSTMERAGIATVERIGRRMSVALAGEHMHVARMGDAVAVAKDGAPAESARGPRQLELLELMDKAKSLGGEAEVRIVVKAQ